MQVVLWGKQHITDTQFLRLRLRVAPMDAFNQFRIESFKCNLFIHHIWIYMTQ